MKIWLDSFNQPPEYKDYSWVKSVNQAILTIQVVEKWTNVEIVDIGPIGQDQLADGGDKSKLVKWLEETGRNYIITYHGE